MYSKILKRLFDVVLSIILLIPAIPIILVVGVFVHLEDNGRAIYKQKRIGKDCKPFCIYKVRSMSKNKNGINEVTKVGKFIRATSIDELPQLINILKGDMSFIGPRPWMEEYVMYFTPEQKRRTLVKPGISGWAQTQGRNTIGINQKLKYDLWYVDNISFWVDIKIIFKTIKLIIKKTGASISENGIQDELKELKEHYYSHMSKNSDELEMNLGKIIS